MFTAGRRHLAGLGAMRKRWCSRWAGLTPGVLGFHSPGQAGVAVGGGEGEMGGACISQGYDWGLPVLGLCIEVGKVGGGQKSPSVFGVH